jgi:hypothetical protein
LPSKLRNNLQELDILLGRGSEFEKVADLIGDIVTTIRNPRFHGASSTASHKKIQDHQKRRNELTKCIASLIIRVSKHLLAKYSRYSLSQIEGIVAFIKFSILLEIQTIVAAQLDHQRDHQVDLEKGLAAAEVL